MTVIFSESFDHRTVCDKLESSPCDNTSAGASYFKYKSIPSHLLLADSCIRTGDLRCSLHGTNTPRSPPAHSFSSTPIFASLPLKGCPKPAKFPRPILVQSIQRRIRTKLCHCECEEKELPGC